MWPSSCARIRTAIHKCQNLVWNIYDVAAEKDLSCTNKNIMWPFSWARIRIAIIVRQVPKFRTVRPTPIQMNHIRIVRLSQTSLSIQKVIDYQIFVSGLAILLEDISCKAAVSSPYLPHRPGTATQRWQNYKQWGSQQLFQNIQLFSKWFHTIQQIFSSSFLTENQEQIQVIVD